MEGDGYSPTFNGLSAPAMDIDFLDGLFDDGCWLETTSSSNLRQSAHFESSTLDDYSLYLPFSEPRTPSISQDQNLCQEEGEMKLTHSSPPFKIEGLFESQSPNQEAFRTALTSQVDGFPNEGPEPSKRWWIAPRANSGSCSSVKDRLVRAVSVLKEQMKDRDFLIQIWVPIKKDGRKFLTTLKQPYMCNYESLIHYRVASESFNFPADEDSKESLGMPGRVFMGKLPEWTPDVRFFESREYPRIIHARMYDVRGALALPVFERGSGSCLGVIEIVTTSQQIKYRPELERVCEALEAFDLTSSNNLNFPSVEVPNTFYQVAFSEIAQLLQSILNSHNLPLALTWAQCAQLGTVGCRHSDENYSQCLCIVGSACVWLDEASHNFLDACSENHLLQSEGIVGRAFKTNKQWFAIDAAAFSKANYPLSHHAMMFGLHAALAIPLRSAYTGSVEVVLELFLPKDCVETEAQTKMLHSLTTFMQLNFRNSQLIFEKNLGMEVIFPIKQTEIFQEITNDENPILPPPKETTQEESLWIAHMMEVNRRGKGMSLSWEYQKEEQKEEFKLMPEWESSKACFDPKAKHVSSGVGDAKEESSSIGRPTLGTRKQGDKQKTKAEKMISLDVLRQYFAGSLKDAAKSIGVCPTTLKRICRQHGISRWPSRKIKKVSHSLRKLQLVIDSVQGVEGSIQLGSFYSSFPENAPNFSGSGASQASNIRESIQPNTQPESELFNQKVRLPKSPSSSCSQSSGSSTCCSTGANPKTIIGNATNSGITLVGEKPHGSAFLKRARSDAQLHVVSQEETKAIPRTQSHKALIREDQHPKLDSFLPPIPGPQNPRVGGVVKVKATLGDSKVRLSLQPDWGYRDIQQEIARRFGIDDINRFDLKYLDDDREWVLLTCDEDLEECIDIFKMSRNHTVRISVLPTSQTKVGSSLGSTGPL